MSHSLINPNGLRIFGVTIQDNPYHAHKSMSLVATTANDEELSIPGTHENNTSNFFWHHNQC